MSALGERPEFSGRLYVSAAAKSSGKTLFTTGLAAALRARHHTVQTFKKGPDYIDPQWLAGASGRPCCNLDFHTQSHSEIIEDFTSRAAGAHISLIEGNKGLFDGVDLSGADSNAALATLLGTPVLLVINARGMTRGIAPLLQGYAGFDDALAYCGVVINNVADSRHERKLVSMIENHTDFALLGSVRTDPAAHIDERHLGLIPGAEHRNRRQQIGNLARCVEQHVDVPGLLARIGVNAAPGADNRRIAGHTNATGNARVTIAVARDQAFNFYYQQDLDLLRCRGAELVFFSPCRDARPPPADALLLGGGFPEAMAKQLADNHSMRAHIAAASANGTPIYAECGGLMYLCRSIDFQGRTYTMAGVLPADVEMTDRPAGRGYVRLGIHDEHPWRSYDEPKRWGQCAIPAHEFHYSRLINLPKQMHFAYTVQRGHGITGEADGWIYNNCLAGYCHLRHTAASPWVDAFLGWVRDCTTPQYAKPLRPASAGCAPIP